jgi:putative transposase
MARFEVPDGWTAQACRFALDPTPAQVSMLESHCGAARFAFNHMLGVVKANLEQRSAERSYGIAEQDLTPSQGWSLAKLRKTWNARKDEVAPWWQANSKEAYNSGLDGLARALQNWSTSRSGERARCRGRVPALEDPAPLHPVGAVHDRGDPRRGGPPPRQAAAVGRHPYA